MKQRARECDRLEAKAGKAPESDPANELERYNKWRRGAEDIETAKPSNGIGYTD